MTELTQRRINKFYETLPFIKYFRFTTSSAIGPQEHIFSKYQNRKWFLKIIPCFWQNTELSYLFKSEKRHDTMNARAGQVWYPIHFANFSDKACSINKSYTANITKSIISSFGIFFFFKIVNFLMLNKIKIKAINIGNFEFRNPIQGSRTDNYIMSTISCEQ